MPLLLGCDPGLNTGIALGYYDAITPFRLIERWQVHGGVPGFIDWWGTEHAHGGALDRPYELVVEHFELDPNNDFVANLTPVKIEGAIEVLNGETYDVPIAWQERTAKGDLIGYPAWAKTKAQRQRVRFNFLERFGLFVPGTEHDDSNDAITHCLVYLKRRKHYPTVMTFWPPRLVAVPQLPTNLGPGF